MAAGDVHYPMLLRAMGCTRSKVNKWRHSGHLSGVPEGRAGVPSVIGRDLALKIAFMSVLTAAGYEPALANQKARKLIEALKHGRRQARIFDPVNGTEHPARKVEAQLKAPRQPVDLAERVEFRPPLALIAVNVPEILDRVDELARLYAERVAAKEGDSE